MEGKQNAPTRTGHCESGDEREAIAINTLKEKDRINSLILQLKELEEQAT